ncbi:Cytoplasmic tRNA 2-thiolation protein 1, partial [Trinorchestia longiramus]
RPKTGDALCKECFFFAFEEEVHHTITSAKLFSPGEYVAIAASGGKDSTVLAHLMTLLNQRYQYGLKLVLLSIDEGITGYRDDSLETVKRNEKQYGIPLKILSYEELYGWTMDKIVQKVGRRNNCTFCGVFRRQALDRGAQLLGVHKLVTGHNADDIAETIVMNVLRGDVARLQRCCAVETGSEGHLPRSKPFKYTYEKEIVMYAYFKKLDYFSTECVYSPNAYRGHARAYIKDLEKMRPTAIIDIIHSGECLLLKEGVKLPTQMLCRRCGHVSSQAVCKACVLLEGLNKGRPRLGVGKSSKVKQKMNVNPEDLVGDVAEETKRNQQPNFRAETLEVKQKDNQSSEGADCVATVAENKRIVVMNSPTSSSVGKKSLIMSSEVAAVGNTVDGHVSPEASNVNIKINAESQSNSTQPLKTTEHHERIATTEHPEPVTITDNLQPITTTSDSSNSSIRSSTTTEDSSCLSSTKSTTASKSPVETSRTCSSQLTSIEDIGSSVSGSGCASAGGCSGNCKNKEKKKRKVISLRTDPEFVLKTAGISKKDLDF